jgi:uncharacterized repeat protein (TIGR03803 family)
MGTVFKQRTAGTANILLYSFSGPDGANPVGGLTLARDGNLYGTTELGGKSNQGTIFRITPGGALSTLYSFTGGADGTLPFAAPIEGNDGNLYGTTNGDAVSVAATVYKLSDNGVLSTIYTFPDIVSNARSPVLQASNGDLYVTSSSGGTSGAGTIVKLTTDGTVKAMHNFSATSGGNSPQGLLIQAADGNIYGTTVGGGIYGLGTIFTLNATTGKVTFLYNFGGATSDGWDPLGGVIQGTDGNLYGTTAYGGTNKAGSIFQLTLGGEYSQLYSFPASQGLNGSEQPSSPPMQDTLGIFYGTTPYGGTKSLGSVFTLYMGLGPFVAFARPSGKPGSNAQILGQGLSGSTSVTFNGVPAASFSAVSDTYMTAVVPTGATTGPVVVTTPTQTLTSNVNFRISK